VRRADEVLETLMLLPSVTMDTWRQEVRAVSLAAAAAEDFVSAIAGYKEIGRSLGLVSDKSDQHVHFHNGRGVVDAEVLREAPEADLRNRLRQITSELEAPVVAAPAEVVDADAEAELERILA
jgi:hypothetical protein